MTNDRLTTSGSSGHHITICSPELQLVGNISCLFGAVVGQMSDNLGNLLFEAFLINFYCTLCDDIPNEKIN